MNHTPGPWIVRAGHPTDVEAPGIGHVASFETVEDALIGAAALEMLAALQWAATVIRPGSDLHNDMIAAIAKATGGAKP
jgi:hypothetical protein